MKTDTVKGFMETDTMKRIAPLFIPKGTSRFYKTYGTLFNSGG
jgi:hypothetical protein